MRRIACSFLATVCKSCSWKTEYETPLPQIHEFLWDKRNTVAGEARERSRTSRRSVRYTFSMMVRTPMHSMFFLRVCRWCTKQVPQVEGEGEPESASTRTIFVKFPGLSVLSWRMLNQIHDFLEKLLGHWGFVPQETQTPTSSSCASPSDQIPFLFFIRLSV